MHAVLGMLMSVLSALADWTNQLAEELAVVAGHTFTRNDFVVADVVVTSAIIALACVAFGAASRVKAHLMCQAMKATLRKAQSEIRFREALIGACSEAIAVLGADVGAAISYRGGGALLQACLNGPQGCALATKLNALLTGGAAFRIAVTTGANRRVILRGCPVGSHAAVFLQGEDPWVDAPTEYRAALEALTMPVWVRKPDLSLKWANRAYLDVAGAKSVEEARGAQTPLVRYERELARAVSNDAVLVGTKRYITVDGERRAFTLNITRRPDSCLVGSAVDVTEMARSEGTQRIEAETRARMLNELDVGIAVFGADKCFTSANLACQQRWGLDKDFLATRPPLTELFDTLRQTRRLPERHDFAEWKHEHLVLFEKPGARIEETWHLADGTSLEVIAHGDPHGGTYYFFKDLTAQLKVEASFNTLRIMDRAILNTLDDAIAIFGPDGKLRLYNDALANLWKLDPASLEKEPHLSAIAQMCASRPGYDVIWKIVSAAVNAAEPARFNDWIKVVPVADNRTLSLSVSRLPLGVTLVRFEDVTDLRRFAEELGPGALQPFPAAQAV